MSNNAVVVSSGNDTNKYTVKQIKVTKAVIACLKAVIAVSCHAIQFEKATSNSKEMWDSMFRSYHGTRDKASQVKKILKGEGRGQMLWDTGYSNEKSLNEEFLGMSNCDEIGNLTFKANKGELIPKNLKSGRVWSNAASGNGEDRVMIHLLH